MNKIDRKILLCLDKNPRVSFTQIGKSARISKEVAQYRYKQLVKKRILTGFFAFINVAKLGYSTYKIIVKYKSVNKEIHKKITSFLINNKIVSWAGDSEGAWDLIITLVSPTKEEFNKFYLDFFNEFGEYFKEKEILLPIDNLIFNDKYLSDGKLIYAKKLQFDLPGKKLDSTDLKILNHISLNSRKTFTEIGKILNLNYWTIAQRFKKLVKNNYIICLKPRIDFRKLGYLYYHFLIELDNEKVRNKIEDYYKQHKSCIMIMNHAGKYSMHLEFVLDQNQMCDIIMEFREKFGNDISSYEPLLIINEHVMNLIK